MSERGTVEFFEPMRIPTVTHNALEVRRRAGGGSYIGKTQELKQAEDTWEAHLGRHVPAEPLRGAVAASVKFLFEARKPSAVGKPHTLKPDLDNLEKTFWDVMVRCGFLFDDAHIATKTITKAWSDRPGVYVRLQTIEQ